MQKDITRSLWEWEETYVFSNEEGPKLIMGISTCDYHVTTKKLMISIYIVLHGEMQMIFC